jgi:hypothetical protein
MSVHLEKLDGILDYQSQQYLYFFNKGIEFDQPFTVVSATIPMGGQDYGYDAFLNSRAPVAPQRKTAWKFVHEYAAGETWSSLKDAMMIAFGHNRPVWLEKTRADGTVVIAEARLSDFPDRATLDTEIYCEFTITFDQRSDWHAKDVTSPRYDSGLQYDTGGALQYDERGVIYICTGAATSFTVVNSGTVNDGDATIEFDGPMTGPITLYNSSCDPRGVPFPTGFTGVSMSIQLSISLATGEYLQIDSKHNTVLSNHLQVNSVGIVSPGAYSTPPTAVVFSGGGGTGAAATVQVAFNGTAWFVTGITMTNGGCGYTGTPVVALTGGTGASAVLVANVGTVVPWSVVTKVGGQHQYFEFIPGNNACVIAKSDSAAAGDVYITSYSKWRS